MKEIHLSKNTYCSFLNPETDNMYDIILMDLKEINNDSILLAKQNRVAKILRETGEKLDITKLLNTDLVFRIMTWDHIPMLPPKLSKADKIMSEFGSGKNIDKFFNTIIDSDSSDSESFDEDIEEINILTIIPKNNIKADHVRINFPPFYHYRLGVDGVPYLVGKSHWIGPLDSGSFSKDHGYMTDTCARMIMKLVEKYASKSNWRNYSYVEEFRGQALMQLIQVALQFDENKSNNPFSFWTSCIHNSFLRILNIEKKNQQLRDTLLVANHMNPSYSRSNADVNSYENGYE
jgi:hypothetical protein